MEVFNAWLLFNANLNVIATSKKKMNTTLTNVIGGFSMYMSILFHIWYIFRDILLRLDLDDLMTLEEVEWKSDDQNIGLCLAKGQSEVI